MISFALFTRPARQAAILRAEAQKEAKIREAEGEAEAILKVQQATADGIRMIREAGADQSVPSKIRQRNISNCRNFLILLL